MHVSNMIEMSKMNLATMGSCIIAHGVNAQGIMGAGFALQFKQRFIYSYYEYHEKCMNTRDKGSLLGKTMIESEGCDTYTACMFTQLYPGRYAKRNHIENAMNDLITQIKQTPILQGLPVFMPKIGCGYGGLSWTDDVEPIIKDFAKKNEEIYFFVCF